MGPRSQQSDVLLPALWFAWMFVSIAGPVVGIIANRNWNRMPCQWQQNTRRLCGITLGIAVLVLFGPLSVRGYSVDAAILAAGYVSLCLLWIVAMRGMSRWLSVLTGSILTVVVAPMLLIVFTGLGFFFIVGDTIPTHEISISPHLMARMTEDGGATVSHNGATIDLLSQPAILPGLEISRYHRRFQDDECESANIRVSVDGQGATIWCGPRPLDVVKLPFVR